jgi:hypothetical protein
LHIEPRQDEKNQNTQDYVDFILTKTLMNLKSLELAPNVGTRDGVVKDFYSIDSIEARQTMAAAHRQEDDYGLPK